MSSETNLFTSFKNMMLGREVRDSYLGHAVVIKWEPLGASGNDVLLRLADGREIWSASQCLTPVGVLSSLPLPKRNEVRKAMSKERKNVLADIQKKLVQEAGKPWPGLEFGKVLMSKALENAIEETKHEQ